MKRKRRIFKIVGTVLSVALLALWICSIFWGAEYVGKRFYMSCESGYAMFTVPYSNSTGMVQPGLVVKEARKHTLSWRPYFLFKRPQGVPNDWGLTLGLPLWIPFVLLSVPTAILWYRDRRRPPPGHCKSCGYDLTGNVSGVCSECGEPT